MQGVDLLLGNDLAGAKVVAVPLLSVEPTDVDFDLETRFPGAFPSCKNLHVLRVKMKLMKLICMIHFLPIKLLM